MKYFPLLLHIVLAALFIGLAYGAQQEHMRPMICAPLTGMGVALGATAVVRLFLLLL